MKSITIPRHKALLIVQRLEHVAKSLRDLAEREGCVTLDGAYISPVRGGRFLYVEWAPSCRIVVEKTEQTK